MNRRQFVQQAIGIMFVMSCLVACAEPSPTKLDPALEEYSQENLTFSLTEIGIIILTPSAPTPETEQVNWIDDTTVEIKIYVDVMDCAQWIDVGYQLVDDNLIVKIIVGDWVDEDGAVAWKCGLSFFEVNIIISELPKKDYQIQLRRGQAAEPRVNYFPSPRGVTSPE